MMGYGAGLGFGFGGWLFMLGFMALIVGAVILVAWAISRIGQPATGPQPQAPRSAGGDAIEILRARFARGEITADEFAAAKQTLEAQR